MIERKDYRQYKAIRFYIFNHQNNKIKLFVRIDDREDYPNHEDRYNQSFEMKPGIDQIQIILGTLIGSGTKKKSRPEKFKPIAYFFKSIREKICAVY